jgi:choline dehydrogenase-like flavoprotein
VNEITQELDKIGVSCKLGSKPLSPNWHLCCTVSLGTCVQESVDKAFEVKGVDDLHVSDISVLKTIIPMNTQIASYLVSFIVSANVEV